MIEHTEVLPGEGWYAIAARLGGSTATQAHKDANAGYLAAANGRKNITDPIFVNQVVWYNPDKLVKATVEPEPEPEPEPEVPSVPGMTLVLNDDFDTFDTGLWYRYDNLYGSGTTGTEGNQELQRYRGENVRIEDSKLIIAAKRENYEGRQFTSGFVSTGRRGSFESPAPSSDTFFPRFGRFEMRAKVPHAQGLWPAFWLRHRDGASRCEVDIMEIFHSQLPGRTHMGLHSDGDYNEFQAHTFLEDPRQPSGWHVYAVDIMPEGDNVRFKAWLDGDLFGDYLDLNPTWPKLHLGQGLFDVSLNLAIGGNWTGHPDDDPLGRLHLVGRCSIGGSRSGYPNSCATTSPQGYPIQRWQQGTEPTFEVDWVRIYEHTG